MKKDLLEWLIGDLDVCGISYTQVEHGTNTATVKEKRALISANPDKYPNPITIVQGSILTYKRVGDDVLFAYFHDGEQRIPFRQLKKSLGIKDIRFYRGNLEAIIGIESGEVSPITISYSAPEAVYFSATMLETAKADRQRMYDIPITLDSSLVANIWDVFSSLSTNVRINGKLRVI